LRDDIAAIPNLTLEQFEGAYLAFVEAFNRGDFVTAFAGLAPDCEFRTLEDLPGERVIVGPSIAAEVRSPSGQTG
jgi:hypothetical protein